MSVEHDLCRRWLSLSGARCFWAKLWAVVRMETSYTIYLTLLKMDLHSLLASGVSRDLEHDDVCSSA